MVAKDKKPVTLYLDSLTNELLDIYCFLSKRNKTRIMNEAIRDYVREHLKGEYGKEGPVQ